MCEGRGGAITRFYSITQPLPNPGGIILVSAQVWYRYSNTYIGYRIIVYSAVKAWQQHLPCIGFYTGFSTGGDIIDGNTIMACVAHPD